MTNVIEQFRAEIAGYASPDSPPALLMARLADVCAQLEASQARIEKLPMAELDKALLKAARAALLKAEPGIGRVRRWQRWSAVVAAAVVCLCAMVSASVVVVQSHQVVDIAQSAKCESVGSGEGCWVWVWTKVPNK